ncbi:hypothetical protein OG264_19040 [Streptomyces xanthophaeus]|uniref:hypothetical protein n=1 Tax=Streptomyces xanthophaeus TaxID=67385 RepID=UPI0038681ECF|nr:hypothetical protein OG264_19040 [Streptomyces xanthophaeus]WST61611.1 hypothetical protein OG605_19395 [Streptomyces xanthophaeus]
MTPHDELRLLPWSGPDGKPCFLSADDNAGYLSRLADNTEVVQLGSGSELLDHALEVLADEEAELDELRLLATDLTEALRNAVRVATSRGHRLPRSIPFSPADLGDVPHLPAISG